MKTRLSFVGDRLVKIESVKRVTTNPIKAKLVKFGLGIGGGWGIPLGSTVYVSEDCGECYEIVWPVLKGHPGFIDQRSFKLV